MDGPKQKEMIWRRRADEWWRRQMFPTMGGPLGVLRSSQLGQVLQDDIQLLHQHQVPLHLQIAGHVRLAGRQIHGHLVFFITSVGLKLMAWGTEPALGPFTKCIKWWPNVTAQIC